MHYDQHKYAEEDLIRWKKEYEAAKIKPGAWPYTQEVEDYGCKLRIIKLICPIIAAALFVVSLF